uniref:Uncharacterized protein n=1 Tax=Timema shepardi TaxID=629360 RepID=A0A7R9G366_TIMSH|nr:unnamed protein product [Timema shepardi]
MHMLLNRGKAAPERKKIGFHYPSSPLYPPYFTMYRDTVRGCFERFSFSRREISTVLWCLLQLPYLTVSNTVGLWMDGKRPHPTPSTPKEQTTSSLQNVRVKPMHLERARIQEPTSLSFICNVAFTPWIHVALVLIAYSLSLTPSVPLARLYTLVTHMTKQREWRCAGGHEGITLGGVMDWGSSSSFPESRLLFLLPLLLVLIMAGFGCACEVPGKVVTAVSCHLYDEVLYRLTSVTLLPQATVHTLAFIPARHHGGRISNTFVLLVTSTLDFKGAFSGKPPPVHPTEIRPSEAELNTTSALANYATEAG